MKPFIIAAAIILSLLLIRFIILRLQIILPVKKLAKQSGCRSKLRLFGFLMPSDLNRKSDIIIESDSTVYSVRSIKLFFRNREVHFWNSDEYSKTVFLFNKEFVSSVPLGRRDVKHRRLGATDFEPNMSTDKPVVPVYMICPAKWLLRVTQTADGSMVGLVPGDKIGNIVFADQTYLKWLIKDSEKAAPISA